MSPSSFLPIVASLGSRLSTVLRRSSSDLLTCERAGHAALAQLLDGHLEQPVRRVRGGADVGVAHEADVVGLAGHLRRPDLRGHEPVDVRVDLGVQARQGGLGDLRGHRGGRRRRHRRHRGGRLEGEHRLRCGGLQGGCVGHRRPSRPARRRGRIARVLNGHQRRSWNGQVVLTRTLARGSDGEADPAQTRCRFLPVGHDTDGQGADGAGGRASSNSWSRSAGRRCWPAPRSSPPRRPRRRTWSRTRSSRRSPAGPGSPTLAQAESYVRRAIATRSIDRARSAASERRATDRVAVPTAAARRDDAPRARGRRPCCARAADPAAACVRRPAARRGPLRRADGRPARGSARVPSSGTRPMPRAPCSAGSAPPRIPRSDDHDRPTVETRRRSLDDEGGPVMSDLGQLLAATETAVARARVRRDTYARRAGRDPAAGAPAPGRRGTPASRWRASPWSACSG